MGERMRSGVAAVVMLLAGAWAWGAPEAVKVEAGQAYVHPASKVAFPPKVGSFVRANVYQADAEAKNVFAHYTLADHTVQISAFANVAGEVPFDRYFDMEVETIMKSIDGAKPESKGEWVLQQMGAARRTGKQAVFTLPKNGDLPERVSVLYVLELAPGSGRFVKVRAGYATEDRAAAQEKVDGFLREWVIP